jgi:hypothetical protein
MHTLPPTTMESECPNDRTAEIRIVLEIEGQLKTEFGTKDDAEHGAIELKPRFPMLQIRIYDAGSQIETRFCRLWADG